MAQFDVYRYRLDRSASIYVVDLQDDFLEILSTRVTAPLYPVTLEDRPVLRLNPTVQVDGNSYYIAVQELTALRATSLGDKIANLQQQRDEIIAAIDFLFTGV